MLNLSSQNRNTTRMSDEVQRFVRHLHGGNNRYLCAEKGPRQVTGKNNKYKDRSCHSILPRSADSDYLQVYPYIRAIASIILTYRQPLIL